MKKLFFALSLLLAAALSVAPAQAQGDSLSLVGYNLDRPDVYVLPNEWYRQTSVVWMDRDLWGTAQVVTMDYSHFLPGPVEMFGFRPCEPYLHTVGHLFEDTLNDGTSYHLQWSDAGQDAGLRVAFLSSMEFQNTYPIGTALWNTGNLQANARYGDDLCYHSGYFNQFIHSIGGTWGDIDGDGDVDVHDVASYEYALFYHGAWSPEVRYTETGINLGRGAWPFSEPSLIGAYLLAVWIVDPTDPLVIDAPYGQPMGYGELGGYAAVPYESSLVGQTLTITAEATAVMAMAFLSDGTVWQQAGWAQNGTVTFIGVPEELTVEQIRVEAVAVDGVTDADLPQPSLPQGYELAQNYPNPFNPATQISFSLERNGDVRLAVYNLTGQLMATLVNGSLAAGEHVVTFDGANLPSGTYLYRLEAPGFVQAKKMVLLK